MHAQDVRTHRGKTRIRKMKIFYFGGKKLKQKNLNDAFPPLMLLYLFLLFYFFETGSQISFKLTM